MVATSQVPGRITPAGISLKAKHYERIAEAKPRLGFLEVHPENYLCGGLHRKILLELSDSYRISFHAVSLSLGSDDTPNAKLLAEMKALADEVEPFHFSDHVAWSRAGNAHYGDLLPLPYTKDTLETLCRNIDLAQTALKRQILLENPSTYLTFNDSTMDEPGFLNRMCTATGCGLLLDINNIVVNAHNHGYDADDYIGNFQRGAVHQYHLSGHSQQAVGEDSLKIDTHDRQVDEETWRLYARALEVIGHRPTLVEWDQNLPELEVLLEQAQMADVLAAEVHSQKETLHEAA